MEHRTFWKPVREPKEKKQWKPGQKPKKEISEYKKGILSHHLSNASKADRAEFPLSVVKAAIERSGGICEYCRKAPCATTHHPVSRNRSGRGVLSNAFRCCGKCHIEIEASEEKKQEIISLYTIKFGDRFWFDQQDIEEYERKQAAINEVEQAKQHRTEQLEPIVELLTTASGRMLKAKEIRFLDTLNESQIVVFARLMQDVIGSTMVPENKIPF